MTLMTAAINAIERTGLPDPVMKLGMDYLIGRTRKQLATAPKGSEASFVNDMDIHAIAEQTDAANQQHYEVPSEFFELALGPRRKYSCCLYKTGRETLAEAEIAALEETVDRAGLVDGQDILELGCGWGSLTLFMGERFPNSRITAVSNSHSQGIHIRGEAAKRGLLNVNVVTADMNIFEPGKTFDRIVSVEMFEHMSNWKVLLGRVHSWLKPNGAFFMHIFTHKDQPYRFNVSDKADWIAQHFFTGGIMPSHGLIRNFPHLFVVDQEWQWNGQHYKRTAMDWLANFDRNIEEIEPILQRTYGRDAMVWKRRWRMFFLATAQLFGDSAGKEWGVSHYRLRPVG